jgi:hypothetical protein
MTTYDTIIFTECTDPVQTIKAIGPYKIASELRLHGYNCLVVDHLSSWSLAEIQTLLDRVVSTNTLFVGIGTTFLQDVSVKPDISKAVTYGEYNCNVSFMPQGKDFENEFVNHIKKINPNCKILLGGFKATDNCSNKNVDIIVRGLAELSIVDIANNLSKKQKLSNSLQNVWGRTVVHRDQEKDYDFANTPMHWQYTDVLNYRVLPLEPARGCIFNCKFCSFPQRGKKTLDYVANAELLYHQLLDNYQRFGITTYQLLDDTFNDSDEKLDRIIAVIQKLPFQPKFWAYNRLDLLSIKPHRIQKLYDAGVRATSFGIESLTAESAKFVGKGLAAERQIETIQNIRSRFGNDFLMHGLFIIGLPYESMKQVDETFEKILNQDIPLHSAYFEALHIRRPSSAWNLSELDLNWQKYGYQDCDPDAAVWIKWKNSFMTFNQAFDKKNSINKKITENVNFHVNGQTAWALMNYSDYSYDRIVNLKTAQVDWHDMTLNKYRFVAEYKRLLGAYLGIDFLSPVCYNE